jgi:hypothetical protein
MMKLASGQVEVGQMVVAAGSKGMSNKGRLRSNRRLVVMCGGSSVCAGSSSVGAGGSMAQALSLQSASSSASCPQHPQHAITNPSSADLRWYLHSHCKPALLPIFVPILPNAESVLFSDADACIRPQSNKLSTAPTPAVGMLKYVTMTSPCLVCGAVCDSRAKICGSCAAGGSDLELLLTS